MIFSRMNLRKMIILLMLCFGLAVVSPAIVAASSGGDGGHGATTGKSWEETDTYRVMNFAILAVLLVVVLRKPAANALNNRIKDIKENLETLEKAKLDAEKELKQYEQKIATLEKESEQILSQYKEQGEVAREKILKEAQASAEKLKEQAKKNIDHEFKVAKKQLQTELMDQALAKAEKRIKDSITETDQDQLVDEYLKKVVA